MFYKFNLGVSASPVQVVTQAPAAPNSPQPQSTPRKKVDVPRSISQAVHTYTRKYCAQDELTGLFYGRRHIKFWPEGFQRVVTAVYNNSSKDQGWTKLKTEQHVGRYLVNTNSSIKNGHTSTGHINQCIEKAKRWKERYGTFAANGTTPPGWEVTSNKLSQVYVPTRLRNSITPSFLSQRNQQTGNTDPSNTPPSENTVSFISVSSKEKMHSH